jgi:hypothetical protein
MMRADAQPRPWRPGLDAVPPGLALAAGVIGVLTVLEGESLWTRWLLLAPAAVASLPLAFPHGRRRQRARVLVAVLLCCWCLVAIASVGILYLPSAVAMIVAARRGRRG